MTLDTWNRASTSLVASKNLPQRALLKKGLSYLHLPVVPTIHHNASNIPQHITSNAFYQKLLATSSSPIHLPLHELLPVALYTNTSWIMLFNLVGNLWLISLNANIAMEFLQLVVAQLSSQPFVHTMIRCRNSRYNKYVLIRISYF